MASGVFHRHMEERLDHVPRTVVRVDDILVTGATGTLGILRIIEENGLRKRNASSSWTKSSFSGIASTLWR